MAHDLPFGWEPWTAPALEDLLPQLSSEEQVRLHNYMRENKLIRTGNLVPCSEGARDFIMIHHVRYALRHYNARHPGEEFDAVKPLMAARAFSRGHMWYHLNFWACCRKSKKIKRFFAEVHYKTVFSSSVRSHQLPPVPGAEKPPSSSNSSSSSVGLDLPPPVPGDEKPPGSRSSVCLDLPPPVSGAEKPPSTSSVCSHLSPPVPGAEKPPSSSSSSSVCLDLPPPVPGDEKPPSSRSSVCLDLPPPVPGAEMPPNNSSVCSHLSPPVPGAEKPPSTSSVCSHLSPPVPGAEKPPSSSSSSSVCLDLPPPVPGDEKPPSSRSSVCLDLPPPVPGAEMPPSTSSVCSHLSPPVPGVEKPPSSNGLNLTVFAPFAPIVETCIIMEEPLGQYWKSCAFCPGYFGILHPKGRKFVCGNDKDRMVQGIQRQGISGLEMPFTCHMGLDSNNGHA